MDLELSEYRCHDGFMLDSVANSKITPKSVTESWDLLPGSSFAIRSSSELGTCSQEVSWILNLESWNWDPALSAGFFILLQRIPVICLVE